jgi:hypothetical protein
MRGGARAGGTHIDGKYTPGMYSILSSSFSAVFFESDQARTLTARLNFVLRNNTTINKNNFQHSNNLL